MTNYLMDLWNARMGGLIKDERGADAIEYLLVIGVICVTVVGLVASGIWDQMITAVFTAVEGALINLINS